jgi:predicted  nucleic acid-binding Zn-ribbon protein
MKHQKIKDSANEIVSAIVRIQYELENKEVAQSDLNYWREREDLHNNIDKAEKNFAKAEKKIVFLEEQIKEIINQLNNEII